MIDQGDASQHPTDASEVACALVLRALHEPIEAAGTLRDLIAVVAALTEDASPVLLDGLVRLAGSSDAAVRRIALQALLLCSARSQAAWNLIVIKNRLSQKLFPHFAALITQAYVATSTSQDKAGMQLRRNLDTFKGAVDLALRGALNGDENGNRSLELLQVLLSSPSSSTDLFRQVQSSTLMDTLMLLANCGMLQAEHMEKFMQLIAARFKPRVPSLMAALVYITLNPVAPHLVCDWGIDGVIFSRMLTAEGICTRKNPEDVGSTEEAFSFALSERSMRSAKQVPKVPIEFIDGAYLAYPEAFEECVEDIRLDESTRWLRSSVDDDLDTYLRNILGSIPSLSRIYTYGSAMSISTESASTASPYGGLQRVLETHPELIRRRSEDISACLHTIIDGLDDSEERYEPVVMEAILTLVKVMSRLNIASEYEYAGVWRRFLLDEGRGTNGIPGMFAEIALAFLDGLHQDAIIGVDDVLRKELGEVERARGTDHRIREAIRAILNKQT